MMEIFEPPKYVTSLIDTINDGAKAAQAGSLAFILVALYLLATVFSTTDEDLLLQHAATISGLGVQVPVIISLAIAPAVFLILHVFTLIRYDMLAANLRQFNDELKAIEPVADQERCRHLLANVEFVQMLTAPAGSNLRSPLFGIVTWLVLAVFPVATLMAVQIGSLREQSTGVTLTQQICLASDLLLLAWFFYRKAQREEPVPRASTAAAAPEDPPSRWRPIVNVSRNGFRRLVLQYFLLAAVFLLDLCYINNALPDVTTVRARDRVFQWKFALVTQPLDLVLCPKLHWGCRYLDANHTTIAGRSSGPPSGVDKDKPDANSKEQSPSGGAFLFKSSLLFANFNDSQMDAVEMNQADLHRATFERTKMPYAIFTRAQLNFANMTEARLTKAIFVEADWDNIILVNTDLTGADLTGAKMMSADLTGANLTQAKLMRATLPKYLTNVTLTGAKLTGADLAGASLTGQPRINMADVTLVDANLSDARLALAVLTNADLTAAILTRAYLVSAKMSDATLNGAYLADADLTAAELDKARLVHADLTRAILRNSKLVSADLSNADLTNAELGNADLSSADLRGAFVTQAQLDQACGTAAQLSTGLILKRPCPPPRPD